jgi:histidinol dehydrogenase
MTVVPARAAGCARIAVCTPNAVDATLAVCALAGVDEVYELGGAQAIGALAYGTASIAPVDKIFGPGNAYVSEAKRQVAGICGVDLPAGPSEVAVIASADADPADAARSLLAEAEHDVDARAYLLTDSAAFAAAVDAAIVRLASGLATRDVALAAIGSSGAIVCDSLDACVRCADAMAIEHVELLGPAAASLSDRLRSYGAVFVGLPSAFGDYGAGPNHTLPTQSSARYAAGLSVYDFVSVRPFIERVAAIDARLIGDCMTLARMEGLPAHEAALAAAITSPR